MAKWTPQDLICDCKFESQIKMTGKQKGKWEEELESVWGGLCACAWMKQTVKQGTWNPRSCGRLVCEVAGLCAKAKPGSWKPVHRSSEFMESSVTSKRSSIILLKLAYY